MTFAIMTPVVKGWPFAVVVRTGWGAGRGVTTAPVTKLPQSSGLLPMNSLLLPWMDDTPFVSTATATVCCNESVWHQVIGLVVPPPPPPPGVTVTDNVCVAFPQFPFAVSVYIVA